MKVSEAINKLQHLQNVCGEDVELFDEQMNVIDSIAVVYKSDTSFRNYFEMPEKWIEIKSTNCC